MPYRQKTVARNGSARRADFLPQETLVSDLRAGLTPSQLVERKLLTLLRSAILPASHLQVSRARRALS